MSELKPCPFCGGEADYGYDSSMILVECTDCYTATAMYMSQDIAAKKWNTRTTDSDLTTATKQNDELISGIKSELLASVSVIFRPHIEGVFAVIEQRILNGQSITSITDDQKDSN